jgi:hypothetical protein
MSVRPPAGVLGNRSTPSSLPLSLAVRDCVVMWRIPPISFGTCETSLVISNPSAMLRMKLRARERSGTRDCESVALQGTPIRCLGESARASDFQL